VNPTRRLLDVLREDLGLTGSKEGCGEGECGACVVLVDGRTVNSCILAVGAVEGSEIETIEGVRESASGAAIVESFAEHGAVQCGFCIPGMIVSAEYLLRTTGRLSDAEIREGIAGNLCRCTGYDRIVEAISQAAGARER
jgi:carbon-monoxide dehydrogenase small subunit